MPSSLLRTDLATCARYSQGGGIYRLIPAAVARPDTIAAVGLTLAKAREQGLSVTPRGAGSAMDGSNVSTGLVLDLTDLDRGRCWINPDRRRASLSPSMSAAKLNQAAAAYGLRLPVDPSSGGWATLGGMISTNASGPRSVRSGSLRRWIQGVDLETCDGPLKLRRGVQPDGAHPVVVRWRAEVEPLLRRHASTIQARYPAVRKNSAGYALDRYLEHGDLIEVVIGSEGTLGVITDVLVELEPVPRHRGSLRVAVRDRADLVTCIETIRTFSPATLEFLDRSFLRLVANQDLTPERPGLLAEAAGLLLADFEGDVAADIAADAAGAAAAVRAGALDVRIAMDRDEVDRLWAVRHGASPALAGLTDGRRSLQVIEDGCVPVERLADYLDAVEAAAAAERIDAVMFGHAGDGHVHVNLLPDLRDPDWRERVGRVFAAVSDVVIRLGGTPSGEHGAGRLRAGLLGLLYGPDVVECFRAVKRAFDPSALFNPGVILNDGSDPLSALKVGWDAAQLPAGTEEYLLAVERDARWGESRWDVQIER
ncbi:MAG: FAD-binding oxidoreductase [Gemmatimonadales bacterium]